MPPFVHVPTNRYTVITLPPYPSSGRGPRRSSPFVFFREKPFPCLLVSRKTFSQKRLFPLEKTAALSRSPERTDSLFCFCTKSRGRLPSRHRSSPLGPDQNVARSPRPASTSSSFFYLSPPVEGASPLNGTLLRSGPGRLFSLG